MALADRAYMHEKRKADEPQSPSQLPPEKASALDIRAVTIILLLAVNAYLTFTILCMVPQARQHFIETMLDPEPINFLAD